MCFYHSKMMVSSLDRGERIIIMWILDYRNKLSDLLFDYPTNEEQNIQM